MPGATTSQRLSVENGASPTNEFLLRALDLDFDDVLDLAFGPVLGTPNLTLQYWVLDAKTGTWRSVGSHPNLRLDPKTREVATYEKGGHAGLLSQQNVYRWRDT